MDLRPSPRPYKLNEQTTLKTLNILFNVCYPRNVCRAKQNCAALHMTRIFEQIRSLWDQKRPCGKGQC